MQLEKCIDKIEKRIHRGPSSALFVNVNSREALYKIKDHFSVGYKFFSAADFAKKDELPNFEEIVEFLEETKQISFVEGIASFFRMSGQKSLEQGLSQLIYNSNLSSKSIILFYQCDTFLQDLINKDPRIENNVFLVEGDKDLMSKITFINNALGKSFKQRLLGINEVIRQIEGASSEALYVETKFKKSQFPNSAYSLYEISSFFEVVRMNYLPNLPQNAVSACSDEHWRSLAENCYQSGDFNGYAIRLFKNISSADTLVSSWKNYDDELKNVAFIVMKYGSSSKSNHCLKIAIENSVSYKDIVKQIYRCITQFKPSEKQFWERYKERKQLLMMVDFDEHSAKEFCDFVDYYGIDALYYLTDLTAVEKEKVIELVGKNQEALSDTSLVAILQNIYPDLYSYLQPYDYRIDKLNSYFNLYKTLKVRNVITEPFMQMMTSEAQQRSYNRILPTRSEKVPSLNKNNAVLYFIDALGVEYLSYISKIANDLGLMLNVTLCHCEVPSITSLNKEFIDEFAKHDTEIFDDIKEIDEIKHSGSKDYNSEKSIYPIHLASELLIIKEYIKKINSKLNGGKERAYIISDHGASRLAVLGRTDTKWEMLNKGKHCGRCCPVSDKVVDEPNEYMTTDNGYWVLANYDMFKGARPGTVEVHGGATLEEVVVPIIEFTKKPENLRIDVTTKIVEGGYKKKQILKFVSNHPINNVSVRINAKIYLATSMDGLHFDVEVSDLKREKEYLFDVLSNNNTLQTNLKFRLKMAGMSENDLL